MITAKRLLGHFQGVDKPFQLVLHYSDVNAKHKVFPVWGEVKYDGVFCAVVVDDEGSTAVSRTGKPFYSEINNLIYPLVPHCKGVWIAELCNKRCSLEVLSGLVNPNRVKPWTAEEKELMRGVDMFFHDALTLEECIAGFSAVQQQIRRNRLHWHVCTADGKWLYSQDELETFAAEEIAKGGEGIVIKQPDADYVAGHKGYRVAKIVRDLHVDLMCLDVQTGKGKRTGQIAKLQFKYKGKLFWADLGEGWTDEKRILLTECWQLATTNAFKMDHPYNPIGKVFHLKALQESSKGVLRLPKAMEMRVDKFVEDVT